MRRVNQPPHAVQFTRMISSSSTTSAGELQSDATAAARIPDGDGYEVGPTNFRFMANAVWSTDVAIARLAGRNIARTGGSS
jgi:hypothetical protein